MTARDLNELFDLARAGDSSAEKQLFGYLSERFRRFARLRIWDPSNADEVVQETMVTILREYRALEVTSSFTAWAYKVLDNRIMTCLQSQRTRDRRMDRDTSVEILGTSSPDIDLRRRLIECLKKVCGVNRRYGRVLNFHSQGYSTPEICERVNLKESTLYSLLHRSRALLQRCLETGDIK
ncbi:MAG: RNA polymerase sigma factor [candidate division Zixibacteria bacterium]|nr:RNA polymerase sigma factor [candidate division Zixibacteria bacterium]